MAKRYQIEAAPRVFIIAPNAHGPRLESSKYTKATLAHFNDYLWLYSTGTFLKKNHVNQ